MSAASLESGSKKAKVCIKPDEPLVGCMAGGSASVSIEVQRISDAVSVPIDAVDSEENVSLPCMRMLHAIPSLSFLMSFSPTMAIICAEDGFPMVTIGVPSATTSPFRCV